MLGLGSPGRDGGNGFGFSRPSAPAPRADDSASTGWQLGGAGGAASGPIAPDDDPDFLRGLGKRRPESSRRRQARPAGLSGLARGFPRSTACSLRCEPMATLLLVEDDPAIRTALMRSLRELGHASTRSARA